MNEAQALIELMANIAKVKENNYAMMRSLVQGDMNPAHCGYKSVEDGLVKCMQSTIKEVEKLTRAFEKAYP